MHFLFFLFFIWTLGIVFIISFLCAHFPIKKHTAAWWASIVLSLILIDYFQSHFHSLPATNKELVSFVAETTHIDYLCLFCGILSLFYVKILRDVFRKIEMPGIFEKILFFKKFLTIERLAAIIILMLSGLSLNLLVYIFFIRKGSHFIFSFLLGLFLGALFFIALRKFEQIS